MRSDINIDDETVELAVSAAVDIIVSELDCHPQDADYQERRRYCRHLLARYLAEDCETSLRGEE